MKEGDAHYVSLTPASTAKETADRSLKRSTARAKGWQFEIPAYKYDSLFKPLEELLQKPPEEEAEAASHEVRRR